MNALPNYSQEELSHFSDEELIECMITDEDRVPLGVIDECERRGEQFHQLMIDASRKKDDSQGRWWLKLHCVNLAGRIPTEAAGIMLMTLMRDMEEQNDENLQEWLAGYWAALFANKPTSLLAGLRAFCNDRQVSWFMRANVMDAVVAMHAAQDEAALSEALDWVANIVQAGDEDFNTRCQAGCLLLDFPRPGYRVLLDELAELQGSGLGRVFDKKDVDVAFGKKMDSPPWHRFNNPWKFYSPDAIQVRQTRWAEEDERRERKQLKKLDDEPFDNDYELVETYVRETPKIGRNDPCPCGSGKKYKKCCLLKSGDANLG